MRFPPWLLTLLRAAMVVALALGSAAIAVASLVYFGEELAPFVLEKLPLPLEDVWMLALRAHVVAAVICLPACLLLFSTAVVRRAPRLHRWLGRVTGVLVLLALVPSGFYLSLFAKGGLPSTLGFMLSGIITAVAMVQGVRTARARRFVEHRRWALHVLGQLSVAVVSRAMLFAFDAAGVEEELAYLVSLWLPVVGSLVLVELVTRRPKLAIRRNRTHEALLDARPLRLRDLRPDAARVARGG
ncbi:MAG TPA: DUF2306 domain-containing protein [Haliangiales bacterium]|nr:DUF2306 domain-containing protein [Haliangiales bacterium]